MLVETPAMDRPASTLPRTVAIKGSGVNPIPGRLAAANACRFTVHAGPPPLRGLEATQVVQAFPTRGAAVAYVNNPLAASWVGIKRVNERDCGLV